MLSRHLHSLALALTVSTLAVILSGAMQLGQAAAEPHRGLSGIAGLLSVLVLFASLGNPRRWMLQVALGCVVAVLALAGLGFLTNASPWVSVLHGCLSHVFFAGGVALLVGSSSAWSQAAAALDDTGSPSLRTLSVVVPVAVFLQIFLGAIYRHVALPVWPHILGSLLVGCLLLYTGMVVLETHGQHPALRLAAQALLAITIAQIALGLAAFLGRVMSGDGLEPEWWMTAARSAHVVTGAMTLGASVFYGMQVFYHVRTGAAQHPMNDGPIGKSVVA